MNDVNVCFMNSKFSVSLFHPVMSQSLDIHQCILYTEIKTHRMQRRDDKKHQQRHIKKGHKYQFCRTAENENLLRGGSWSHDGARRPPCDVSHSVWRVGRIQQSPPGEAQVYQFYIFCCCACIQVCICAMVPAMAHCSALHNQSPLPPRQKWAILFSLFLSLSVSIALLLG